MSSVVDKVQALYNRARELAESEETEYGRLFASGQVDAFSQVLRAIGETEGVQAERRRKQPDDRVWEHCATTEPFVGTDPAWLPRPPPGSVTSWELVQVLRDESRGGARVFWKRRLP